MTKIVNGAISVPSFDATGNPGEYQITGATFVNQSDTVGNGTYDLQENFVIYVPASDPNTFMPIPGVVHRYKITSLTIIDQSMVDIIIKWDEPGDEYDMPTNGVECLLTQTSDHKKLGYTVDQSLYPNLASYVSSGALNNDIQNIADLDNGGSSGGAPLMYLKRQSTESTIWLVEHNQNRLDYTYTIFDTDNAQCLPDEVETVDSNTIKLYFLAPMGGKAVFMFV